jgi:hypothetical protein
MKALAYVPEGNRDDRLDWLRGYAILAIMVNHIVTRGTLLNTLSGNMTFYTSAAEAFFAISGVVLGMISARRSLRDAARRLIRRAAELYGAAVLVGLLFSALGWFTDLRLWNDGQEYVGVFGVQTVLNLVTRHLTGLTMLHGASILFSYCLFMLLGLGALFCFHEKKPWLPLLLSGVAYVIVWRNHWAEWPFATVFPFLRSQPIFIVGLWLGYYRQDIAGWLTARLGGRGISVVQMLVLLAALFFLIVKVSNYALLPQLPGWLGDRELRPAQMALVALYLFAFYLLVGALWRPLRAGLGWLLLPIGRQSLWAFVTHIFVITLIINLPGYTEQTAGLAALGWQVLAVALVWLSVKAREALKPRFPNHPLTRPAVFGATLIALATGLAAYQTVCGATPCQRAATVIDGADTRWVWRGFVSEASADAAGDQVHAWRGLANPEASIRLSGRRIEVYGATSRDAGAVEVWVDGALRETVNLRSSNTNRARYRFVDIPGQRSGETTLMLRPVGTGPVIIDYVKVWQ